MLPQEEHLLVRRKKSLDEEQVASVAVVIRAVATIEGEVGVGKSGPPGDPGTTFDDIFDWKIDED